MQYATLRIVEKFVKYEPPFLSTDISPGIMLSKVTPIATLYAIQRMAAA